MQLLNAPLENVRTYVEGAGGVAFSTRIDGQTVRCYVTRQAMRSHFGDTAEETANPASASLRAFDRHVAFICSLARQRWHRLGPDAEALVLTAEAVSGALAWRQRNDT
jgi:hypothetical protein